MWDETDGLYYDQLVTPDGTVVPVKVRSMVGIIPLLAVAVVEEPMLARAKTLGKQLRPVPRRLGGLRDSSSRARGERAGAGRAPVARRGRRRPPDAAVRASCSTRHEFLSPYGLRALSAYHREHPYELDVEGVRATIDYEPAESTTSMFGGNSNWRGPIWFPLNYLLISALERYHRFFGDELEIEYPTGSGQRRTLDKIADDLRQRLVSLFLRGADGRRPCFGGVERMQSDPAWKDNLLFNEYFHGDNGAGLGASHQTGWTGVVADLIRGRPGRRRVLRGRPAARHARTARTHPAPRGTDPEENVMTLDGKVAIVTGGNSGIGKAVVLALAAAGAKIVIDYVANEQATEDLERQIAALGDQSIGVEADVSKVADLERLVGAAVKAFGRLDIMVNNAGVETRTSVLDTTEAQYDKVLDINLKSAFFGTQIAAKQMIAQGGGGRIINITSVHEDWPMPDNTAYCLSKGGMRMLTRTAGRRAGAARRHRRRGRARARSTRPSTPRRWPIPQKMETLDAAIPLGRMAKPEEIGSVVAFLAGDGASYLTATTIFADGGIMHSSPGL